MLKRLGLVAWWLGAIVLALTGAIAVYASISTGDSAYLAIFVYAVIIALALWSLAFILGGSFWRPPKP
jgi:hypothetical protein